MRLAVLTTVALDTDPQSGPDTRNGLKLAARFGRIAEALTPFAPRALPRFARQDAARCWLGHFIQARSRSRPVGALEGASASAQMDLVGRCRRKTAMQGHRGGRRVNAFGAY